MIFIFIATFNNSFDPFNKEEELYSIIGGLDLHTDTNFIRVKDLNVTLGKDTAQQVSSYTQ